MARRIELLSPARNAVIAREAILHGADAVYIGAPKYGARASAGNSLEDIASLVEFAHLYDAKVYVALNTIIYDDELSEVEEMIKSLYEIGVDALIVQDMSILKMDIPPIQLHASTQCDNTTLYKVKFLKSSGFSQVVLARELNISQIEEICKGCDVPVEVFVHGALCVSYSGRCYLSRAISGRSANRGECAQYCRLPYNLEDADGNILLKDKHLLSLKDMNRSQNVEQLLDAGVTSLKIEGRLKDVDYVKNITAYYRLILDEIFTRRPEYISASSGKTILNFTPNPYKSFNRGFTPYLLKNRQTSGIASMDTPKSKGEKIGVVKRVENRCIEIDCNEELHNGDGFCFTSADGVFTGFRVNRVEGTKLFPATMPDNIKRGDVLYRNFDIKFDALMSAPTSERKIATTLKLVCKNNTLLLQMLDNKDNMVEAATQIEELQPSKTPQRENQKNQLSKLGGTPFEAKSIDVSATENLFVPMSVLAKMRREAVEKLISLRIARYKPLRRAKDNFENFYTDKLSFESNVSNQKAQVFYNEHGVENIEPAYEISPKSDAVLMTTKHCIRRELGKCLMHDCVNNLKSTLYLTYGKTKLQLNFNCKECAMTITKVQ